MQRGTDDRRYHGPVRASERDREQRRLTREVARSVDAPPSLVPVFHELFAGMPSLGSSPRRLISMLQTAGVGRGDRVLDLACGKGTIAVEMARRLGCEVIAVDGCRAFLDEGRRRAERLGVANRARFVESDVRVFASKAARGRDRWDVALMIGLLPIEEAAPMLRRLVHSGGLYAIDDVFRDERLPKGRSDFLSVPTRHDCIEIIEGLGDRVEAVDVAAPSRVRSQNASLYRRLAANARAVRRRAPGLSRDVGLFLANQRHANWLIGGQMRPAMWLARRA